MFVPEVLKRNNRWVCRRKDKIPINPRTGAKSKCHSRDSEIAKSECYSFDEAIAACEGFTIYPGVGYVFIAGDGIVGVDLDGCRNPDTGNITKWARKIVDTLSSFAEISPSGAGLHVYIKAQKPGKQCNPSPNISEICNEKPKIEIYESARYFAFTGDHLDGTPETVEERQEELDRLWGEWFPNNKSKSQAIVSNESGDVLVQREMEKSTF